MERHYIKDLIKSMFRMDTEGNNGTPGNSNDDLLSINYSTDDEAEFTSTTTKKSPSSKSNDGVHHSPETLVGPRSVKEVEESHASLKKENFNLKLRIYFLEERMNTDFNINPDNAVMKNIELKVQVESLRKELSEKQEMLCLAVKTMELDEEDYKKLLIERDKKFIDLEKEYQSLQRKYEVMEQDHGDISLPDPQHLYHNFDLEATISELENKLADEHGENVRLKAAIDEEIRSRDLRISCLQAEVEEKTAIISEQHKRSVSLESDMEKRYLEIKRLKEDRSEDMKQIAVMEGSLRESQQAIESVEQEYEHESMKVNRIKLSLSQRNKRIMELEDIVRRQKTHIGTLEAQVRQPQPLDSVTTHTPSVATSAVAVSAQCAAAVSALSGEPSLSLSPPASMTAATPHQNQQISIDNDQANTLPSPPSSDSPQQQQQENDESTSINNQTAAATLDTKVLEKSLDDSRHHIMKLEKDRRRAGEIIHSMLEKRKELLNEISKLKEAQKEKDEQISQLKLAIQELKNESLSRSDAGAGKVVTPKTSTQSSSEITNQSNSSIIEDSDLKTLCAKYHTLADDLETQKDLLLAIIKEKDAQMQKLDLDHKIAVADIKIKSERICDLEHEIRQDSNSQSCEKIDTGSEKQATSFWIIESEEKDREIERLESDLKKRNANIQTLVNKELWEKNREIDQIHQVLRTKDSELEKLRREMDSLKAELQSQTPQCEIQQKLRHSIEDRKKLLDQIEIMYIDNPESQIDTHKDYLHLKNEYKQLKDEFERSERMREQTNDICSVLSNRLEELAFFLDSLLKQKSLLGFLGNKKNCKLRQIIDQSLDLSRTLNMNLSQMNADQSLLQLTNISNFLNSATSTNNIDTDDAATEDETPLQIAEQSRIIAVLRQQIETMKGELQRQSGKVEQVNYDESVVNILLDISKMDEQQAPKTPQMILRNLMSDKLNIQQNEQLLNTTSTTLKYWQEGNSTESESWSEPDRNVSKQRIGLNQLNRASTDDTEEDAQRKLTKSKRGSLIVQLQEENRELKEKISAQNDLVLQTEKSFCAVSEQLKNELKILDCLRLENDDLMKRIAGKQGDINECEAIKLNNIKQIRELHDVIDELHKQQDELKLNSDVKSKELLNRINQLEQEKTLATSKTLMAEDELQKLKLVVNNYEASLKELYREKMRLESALHQESDLIQKQAENFKVTLKQLQDQSENEVKRITETALVMKQRYESEYVKRAELDKMMSSIKELESLQMVLNTTEEKIQLLEDNEAKLKASLQDTHQEYREKLIDLRKELDLSTLKYSEIMLEKTRQVKEKATLEVQIKEYANKEEDFKRQVADFQQALNSMKEVFQTQVAKLNTQKSALQLKLLEVEHVNEQLRSTIEKSNTNKESKTSNSAPSTPNKFFSLFMGRQYSYSNDEPQSRTRSALTTTMTTQSGDNQPQFGDPIITNTVVENSDNSVYNGGNTSPDLGIDSDPGRFSSLEINSSNVNRPFLNTLELSQQMQQLLLCDVEQTVGEAQMSPRNETKNACNNGRCQGVIEENSHLREKLLKTRSALEETVSQLKYANEKKKHVEKTICKQIHKTSQVLRKAKANLDSGSETDLRK